ncbi:hypothetical protein WPS_09180 [Vulcanimicrobium alpinum]|uniref:Inner membrane protein YgaP-like transmembrane domain-containing protein n=1 Tax=Vulcanimicrobium alpinum TaxID=3016050 RepID=A0AAN1XU80_UNVUL|nr:DUF2892 domain-containing protein [Vulcanimicrobium alpinum]BDE05642.1 hypothetical protein WPS_09180 [Vulcanimicrobium alpinum]
MRTSLWSELGAPADRRGWTIERIVRAVGGTVALASLVLAAYVDLRWLWLGAFVGVNLIQSAYTGWCLMSNRSRSRGGAHNAPH